MEEKGILIAADANVEWMMPWWHKHFSAHNDYPIVIADLGLSDNGIKRAQSFGSIIRPTLPSFSDMPISHMNLSTWKQLSCDDIEAKRAIWLKKPFLLSYSPFERTLWLDVDCRVRGNLKPAFNFCKSEGGLSVAKAGAQATWIKYGLIPKQATLYNSGVISYQKNAPLLKDWQETIMHKPTKYFSDDTALSDVLFQTTLEWKLLPRIFNSRPWEAEDPKMQIIHYANAHKKLDIMYEVLLQL